MFNEIALVRWVGAGVCYHHLGSSDAPQHVSVLCLHFPIETAGFREVCFQKAADNPDAYLLHYLFQEWMKKRPVSFLGMTIPRNAIVKTMMYEWQSPCQGSGLTSLYVISILSRLTFVAACSNFCCCCCSMWHLMHRFNNFRIVMIVGMVPRNYEWYQIHVLSH